jgi:glycosyltransferase involved in cell wall biosynthesis
MSPQIEPRFSVVICTYNRADYLKKALEGLRRQTYSGFEVVVVNGPSTDGTQAILNEYANDIRIGCCPEKNVSASRNVAIDMAQGEILAFIDDDAVADPKWLEELRAAYTNVTLAAAGGPVFDGSTGKLAWNICVCTRAGEASAGDDFLEDYIQPGADPFFYLAGTNMSFKRAALLTMGGFNEALGAYGYDDVDICRRLIDAGKAIEFVRNALVYHYPAASVLRDSAGIYRDPYSFIKARSIFAMQTVSDPALQEEARVQLNSCIENWRNLAHNYLDRGIFDQVEHDRFVQRLSDAVVDGIAIAKFPPKTRSFAHSGHPGFHPFPLSSAVEST